ncbi:MAG: primosomal protein N', partial [Nitrospirota bacterium]
MTDLVADIAVGVSVPRTFHYLVPEELRGILAPGSRVLVPFGSRSMTGTVVGFPEKADVAGLKWVLGIEDGDLTTDLLSLARWMSDYYLYPLGQTIEAVVPKALTRAKPRKKKYIRLAADFPPEKVRGKKQHELIGLLASRGEVSMVELIGFSPRTIASLRDAGIIEVVLHDAAPSPEQEPFIPAVPPPLMPEQAEAVKRISESLSAGAFAVFLLHGVTGSGKTEVYLRSIAVLAGTGRGAIVLVPEIALTPQLLSRFRQRFGNRVAVLHSGLSDRERADEYRRIREGRVDVAVGARSAVFAPFENVGLLIVDEEHENSYKQDEGLRYHARDVAIMRAKFRNAVCVLGSATPSLESYYNAKSGKYRYLRLANRVDHRPMPEVLVIDAKTLPKNNLYSPRLVEDIKKRLEKNEQTLLLLNRRGFSSVLICGECGAAVKCPH